MMPLNTIKKEYVHEPSACWSDPDTTIPRMGEAIPMDRVTVFRLLPILLKGN